MDKLNKRNLEILVKNDGFKFVDTFFPYTSGKIGPYYVNSEVVMKNGSDYNQAIMDMYNLVFHMIAERVYGSSDVVISGGERRDWIFSLPTANRLEKSHLMIYKDGKIIGPEIKNRNVIHIADINNEGSSPRDKWIPTIRNNGGKIKDIFFYVDRMEDGRQVTKELGLDSLSLVYLNADSWSYLREKNIINEEIFGNLMVRNNDREEWARKMLRSDNGFRKWVEIFDEDKVKGYNIITKGYPDIRDEMIERLDKPIKEFLRGIHGIE